MTDIKIDYRLFKKTFNCNEIFMLKQGQLKKSDPYPPNIYHDKYDTLKSINKALLQLYIYTILDCVSNNHGIYHNLTRNILWIGGLKECLQNGKLTLP